MRLSKAGLCLALGRRCLGQLSLALSTLSSRKPPLDIFTFVGGMATSPLTMGFAEVGEDFVMVGARAFVFFICARQNTTFIYPAQTGFFTFCVHESNLRIRRQHKTHEHSRMNLSSSYLFPSFLVLYVFCLNKSNSQSQNATRKHATSLQKCVL